MARELAAIFSFFSFALGACLASFLNVVIWRVPRGESIVSPPSHCPHCGAAIRWYQNVPILSWLALRGRCAHCHAPISPRYLLVELLGGLLFWAAFWRFGVLAPEMWLWLSLMIVGSFIDFDHHLLPDFVTVGGMILGVFFATLAWLLPSAAMPLYPALQPFSNPLLNSLAGLGVGFGGLWLVRYLGSLAFRREAMGLGDVFLLGAIGALFGPLAVLVTLILASLVGSIVGVGMILMAKAHFGSFVEIPFGPYLCAGCCAWMFAGPELVHFYVWLLRLLGLA